MRKESFEEKLRKSYDSFEPSTSAQGWSAIESGLGKSAAGKFLFSSGLKWTMGIGLVLGILGFPFGHLIKLQIATKILQQTHHQKAKL